MCSFSDWFLLIFFEENPRNIKTFKKLPKNCRIFLHKELFKAWETFFFFSFPTAHIVLKFKELALVALSDIYCCCCCCDVIVLKLVLSCWGSAWRGKPSAILPTILHGISLIFPLEKLWSLLEWKKISGKQWKANSYILRAGRGELWDPLLPRCS